MERIFHLLHRDASIGSNHIKCAFNTVHASLIDFSSDCGQKFEDWECPVIIEVECVEECWHVLLADANFELVARLLELKQVQAVWAIVVHDIEHTLKPDDATRSPLFQPIFEEAHHVFKFVFFFLALLLLSLLLWRLSSVLLSSLFCLSCNAWCFGF